MRRLIFGSVCGLSVFICVPRAAPAAELKAFPNAFLVRDAYNGGDTFSVTQNGKAFRLKLYFADAPEAVYSEKIRREIKYFGAGSADTVLYYGREAAKFSSKILNGPFTFYTSFEEAENGAYYCFIKAPGNSDMGSLLVYNGFAGVAERGRGTPERLSASEMYEYLRSLERKARRGGAGIWAAVKARPDGPPSEKTRPAKININSATREELMSVKGIGSVLSRRIIENRPYSGVEDLLKVKGIGKKSLSKIRDEVCAE